MAIQIPPLPPPPKKKVNKQTNNKKKVNAVFWHSRSFILHLCSSLSSVQMIVTLPVTFFFFLTTATIRGKPNCLDEVWEGISKVWGSILKKVRVGRKRKIFRWQSDSTIKFCCLFSTICKWNQAVWEYKGGSAPTQKKKKNLCIACSKAFIWSSAAFRVGQRELIVGG